MLRQLNFARFCRSGRRSIVLAALCVPLAATMAITDAQAVPSYARQMQNVEISTQHSTQAIRQIHRTISTRCALTPATTARI
jgi:hypothetical protein